MITHCSSKAGDKSRKRRAKYGGIGALHDSCVCSKLHGGLVHGISPAVCSRLDANACLIAGLHGHTTQT